MRDWANCEVTLSATGGGVVIDTLPGMVQDILRHRRSLPFSNFIRATNEMNVADTKLRHQRSTVAFHVLQAAEAKAERACNALGAC